MNIYDYYTAVTEQFTYPSTPDALSAKATVYFEWGDTVVAQTAATLISGSTYSITVPAQLVDGYGTWRVKWEATFSGTAFYSYTNFRVERPYVSQSNFMTNNPGFNNATYTGTPFQNAEKLARNIINTYCGQEFQMVKNRTLTIDGNGRSSIHLQKRINWFSKVLVDDVDYTTAVELDPKSNYFIRLKANVDPIDAPVSISKFTQDIPIYVTADWGWVDVPWQIEQATELLIVDCLDDVRRETHRYGVARSWQDSNRLEMKDGIFDTTGNVDVDVLIMDFVYWTFDYVT